MRSALYSLVLLLLAAPGAAQVDPPSGLAALELDRSRTCVDVLSRLEALDVELTPLAVRAQRLLGIAGAINIEEASVVDSLDVSDPVEAAVGDWFRADAELAQRYLTEQSQTILDERAAGREAILASVEAALERVQAEADSIVVPTGDLRARATTCSGAILLRGAAVEACTGLTSRVCQAARDSASTEPFRFTESAEFLWNRQELRPWTTPGPIQVLPDGQLSGARTIGFTRTGNLVVSLSFNPMLRARDELPPASLQAFDSINVPLGIQSTHPQITFAPSLGVQVSLPQPLADETLYLIHFGPAEEPDILWTGEAGTGAPLTGAVALAPEHVARLRAGEPMTLTAVREVAGDEMEGIFAIELSSLNQVRPVETLLGYMAQQLSADLARLVPPEGTEPTPPLPG